MTSRNERVVLIGFLLTFGFMFAEVIGGLLSGSLALIADAGHMMTDAAALALAWAGFRFGRRAADKKRTFGYMRFEVLAGFVNAVALMLLVAWIAYEAALRLLHPAPVLAGPMMAVAVLGLLVNGGVFYMLMQGDREHVNIKGALLHVMGDLLGSVAAIVAAGIIWLTGCTPIDPILSVLLSALVLRAAWSLLRNSLHILMEGAPSGLDTDEMRARLVGSVPGLADVSHIHVWSITSGRATATMHVALAEGADPASVVRGLKARLAQDYEIGHSTVEIDWEGVAADCPIGRPVAAGAEEGRGGPGPDQGGDPGCGSEHPGREPAERGPDADACAHATTMPGRAVATLRAAGAVRTPRLRSRARRALAAAMATAPPAARAMTTPGDRPAPAAPGEPGARHRRRPGRRDLQAPRGPHPPAHPARLPRRAAVGGGDRGGRRRLPVAGQPPPAAPARGPAGPGGTRRPPGLLPGRRPARAPHDRGHPRAQRRGGVTRRAGGRLAQALRSLALARMASVS